MHFEAVACGVTMPRNVFSVKINAWILMPLARVSTPGRIAMATNVLLRWKGTQGEDQLTSNRSSLITAWSPVRKLININVHERLAGLLVPCWDVTPAVTKLAEVLYEECVASCRCLRQLHFRILPGQAICSRHPLQCSSHFGVLTNLTHKLSAGSPTIPRESSIHSHHSLAERAHVNYFSLPFWLVL